MQRLFLVIVAASAFLALSPSGAGAGLTCDERVLRDWSRDGQIDRVYSPPCYSGAIDLLPTDLRDYTDAEDVISRALASAVRANSRDAAPKGMPVARRNSEDSLLRLLPAALAGLSLALLAAGGVGYLARRLRARPTEGSERDTLA